MSNNPWTVGILGDPSQEQLRSALSPRFEFDPLGRAVDRAHPPVTIELDEDPLAGGRWLVDVRPDSMPEQTRLVAHEVKRLLRGHGIDAIVFRDDPDYPDLSEFDSGRQ